MYGIQCFWFSKLAASAVRADLAILHQLEAIHVVILLGQFDLIQLDS